MDMQNEFERQVTTLLEKGYHKEIKEDETEFRQKIAPLEKHLEKIVDVGIDFELGKLPFVIVVKSELIPVKTMMSSILRQGKEGITKLFPHEPEDFGVISEIQVPETDIYLLLDIDRGKDSLNVRPEDAMKKIKSKGRSPLTIDEGIAIVTHYPEFLMKNNCFSLLGSRHQGDQRVPAIWISGKKHPNLGWCWDRNPHTWLGSASCRSRI